MSQPPVTDLADFIKQSPDLLNWLIAMGNKIDGATVQGNLTAGSQFGPGAFRVCANYDHQDQEQPVKFCTVYQVYDMDGTVWDGTETDAGKRYPVYCTAIPRGSSVPMTGGSPDETKMLKITLGIPKIIDAQYYSGAGSAGYNGSSQVFFNLNPLAEIPDPTGKDNIASDLVYVSNDGLFASPNKLGDPWAQLLSFKPDGFAIAALGSNGTWQGVPLRIATITEPGCGYLDLNGDDWTDASSGFPAFVTAYDCDEWLAAQAATSPSSPDRQLTLALPPNYVNNNQENIVWYLPSDGYNGNAGGLGFDPACDGWVLPVLGPLTTAPTLVPVYLTATATVRTSISTTFTYNSQSFYGVNIMGNGSQIGGPYTSVNTSPYAAAATFGLVMFDLPYGGGPAAWSLVWSNEQTISPDVVWVQLSHDDGSAWNGTTATWTYTVKSIDGTTTYGTGAAYNRPVGAANAATYGAMLATTSNFSAPVLIWANETPINNTFSVMTGITIDFVAKTFTPTMKTILSPVY